MIHSWSDLDERDRARFQTAAAFLKGRLAEPETIDWALRLKPDRRVDRKAIFELLAGPDSPQLREPYATTWLLIVESWSSRSTRKSAASALLQIRRRLRAGDRSGTLIEEISDLVAPRLEVKPLQGRPWLPARKPRRPESFHDLLTANLTSASLLYDFREHRIDISLDEIANVAFLHAVASALVSAVDRGLYIARRIYSGDEDDWPAMASPLRVYFVRPEIGIHDRNGPGGRVFEPDAATRGIGPAVKLLYSVLQRITELDAGGARSFLGRWRYSDISIYRRLWAAAARNAEAVTATEIREFLVALDDSDFWNLWSLPEFAELRAVRFSGLEPGTQAIIVRRLRKGPPRKILPRKLGAEEVRATKRAFAAMELRRIEIGGGVLPAQVRDWLLEAADEFPSLKNMAIDGGFRDPWVRPDLRPRTSFKSQFDGLEGKARLQALEDALSGEPSAGQATDWLRRPGHAVLVLCDFEAAAGLVNRFPRVWDHFGYFHSRPAPQSESEQPRDAQSEANRVLGLMSRLSDATVEPAIEGICHWLHMWSEHVVRCELGQQVWLCAWPPAVKVTNAAAMGEDKVFSGASMRPTGEERVPDEINTLHLPAGKLVRVFLELFRFTDDTHDPFSDGSLFAQMRDCAIGAPGRSGLIACCLLTQKLPAFLQADPAWTRRHLVEPLSIDNDKSILLWHAVASIGIDTDVLEIIGDAASRRVLDDRLSEVSRKDLVSCLVYEALAAFREHREPSITYARISQTLRSANDEIREWAAFEIRQFQEYAYKGGQGSRAPGISLLSTVKPFLEQVWPQERSLATSGVSRHLSCLPAVSGEAFAEVVDVIERFLTPFDCWSMLDYGYCEGDMSEDLRMPRLSNAVDDMPKAHALLRLLDLTIGHTQDAVVPDDLSIALDRIESEAPMLTSDPAFRRLAAAARR